MTSWRTITSTARVKYRVAIFDSATLAVACLLTYMLVTDVLSHVYQLSRDAGTSRTHDSMSA